jgi:hypothetical protein
MKKRNRVGWVGVVAFDRSNSGNYGWLIAAACRILLCRCKDFLEAPSARADNHLLDYSD